MSSPARQGDEEIEVWGTGSATREFLYVDDAADGIVQAAEHYDGAEPVNLGADRELLIKELVEIVAELTGFEGRIRWDESKPDGQPRRCVDAVRAPRAVRLRGRGPTSARASRATIEWYRGQSRPGRVPVDRLAVDDRRQRARSAK